MNTQFNTNFISGIMPNDKKIEIFGCKTTRKVFFIQNGKTQTFNELDKKKKESIADLFFSDAVAQKDLGYLKLTEALEEFALCCFGAADNSTDIYEDGTLGNVEFNTCDTGCRCEKWESKKVKVNEFAITPRELQVLKFLATDYADKEIAHILNISTSTLDSHKTNLTRKFHVHSKSGLISEAIKFKIITL